jgi:hypothetical protein
LNSFVKHHIINFHLMEGGLKVTSRFMVMDSKVAFHSQVEDSMAVFRSRVEGAMEDLHSQEVNTTAFHPTEETNRPEHQQLHHHLSYHMNLWG